MNINNNFTSKNKIIQNYNNFKYEFNSNPTYQKNGFIYKALKENWKEVKNSDEFLISVYNFIRISLLFDLDNNISNYNISIVKYTLKLLLEQDHYFDRAFTLSRAVKDPEDFLVKLLNFKLFKSNNEINNIIEYSNNNNKIKKLKEFKKVLTKKVIEGLLNKYDNSNNYEKNLLKSFFIDILTVGSSYNPIGIKENNEIKIGRVYDGLQVQWNTQGNNNYNRYVNVRQRPNNGRKWVPNKIKFNYIIKHWKNAEKIIKENKYEVITPLKNFLEQNSNNVDRELNNLKDLLKNICDSTHYLNRAYALYEYLYDRNYTIDGYNTLNENNTIEFITHSKNNNGYHKVGTFLSPIYALYIYIKKIEYNKLKKKIKSKKSQKKTISRYPKKKSIHKNSKKI